MRNATFIALTFPAALQAQLPTATLDTAVLRIGEQAILTLAVDWPAEALMPSVEWPMIGDTLVHQVEVVRRSDVDTLLDGTATGERFGRLTLQLTITSFDTGFWAIPPFLFRIDAEELPTTALLLEVRPTELDEGGRLRDIRDIHEPPFDLLVTLQRLAPWILGAAVIALLVFLVRRVLERRKQPARDTGVVVATKALHERIIEELRVLEAERLWQAGQHKAYHARLTDLLRSYIEERYQVPARERTTDELLLQLRLSAMSSDQRERLANILRLADLVKFAKASPSPIENEQAMTEALRLVQGTADHGQDRPPAGGHPHAPLQPTSTPPHAH